VRLDIRWPIGGLFTITGVMLVIYGVVSDPAIYQKSLGINVNLWWGVVLVVFGSLMLVLAHRASGGWAGWRRALSAEESGEDPRVG